MANRKLIVEIVGDSRSLERSFGRSTRSAQKFSVGLGTIFKGAAGFLAVQKSADLAGDAIRTGIREFAESAKVQAQTAAALKSTGRVANVTARQVENLSGSLSRLSGIDDELIHQGANLILTFKNVRNEVGKGNDIFDRAAKSAVDLSVAGFGSIETTAKQLGKALNDPIRGMTALARAGVTFSDAQRKQIKVLVESNHVLEAQKLILREVESQVGGSAKALGETLPGKLNILRETFNNLAGTLVAKFEPAIKKTVDSVVDWLSKTKNQQRIQRDLATVTKTVVSVVKAFVAVMQVLRDVLGPVVRLVGGLENAIKLLLAVMVAAKVASFATAISGVGAQSVVAAGQVGGLRLALSRLALISAIAIPITVFLNRDQISRKFNELTDKFPGGGGGKDVVIGIHSDPKELRKLREELQGMGGDSADAIKQIDAMLKKIAALKSKKVNIEVGSSTAPRASKSFADPILKAMKDLLAANTKRSTSSTTRTGSSVAGVPVVESHVTVSVDGQTLTKVVTKGQTKTARGIRQKRGPNRRQGGV